MWTAGMCGNGAGTGKPCQHDSAYGGADAEEGDVFCPLISLSLNGVWPHEWAVEQVPWVDSAGVTHSYDRPGICSEYADELPAPGEPPVIAVDLFGVYQAEPAPVPSI